MPHRTVDIPTLSDADQWRFWEKVALKTLNGCWEWQGSTNNYGYGKFGVHRTTFQAHRVAYKLMNPTTSLIDVILRHSCDNPVCCNPFHLVPGTQLENLRDMRAKGRQNDFGKRVA